MRKLLSHHGGEVTEELSDPAHRHRVASDTATNDSDDDANHRDVEDQQGDEIERRVAARQLAHHAHFF